jgi:hydrogenase expression/formation protein HypC
MCIAMPCKVIEINGDQAVVELEGARKTAFLDLVEDVKVGDWVIVHAGYALSRMDEEEAQKTLDLVAGVDLSHEVY